MRLLATAATVAVVFFASSAAISIGGDRDLVTPPPESVAESFVRFVAEERFEQASRLCPGCASLDKLHAHLGEVDHVEAREVSRDGDAARVEVTVRTPDGEATIMLTLAWDGSEWKVTEHSPEESRS